MNRLIPTFVLTLVLVACSHNLHTQEVVYGATAPIVASMKTDKSFTPEDVRLFQAAIARGPEFLARPSTDHGPPPPLTVAEVIASESTQEAKDALDRAAAEKKAADDAAAAAAAAAEAHRQRVLAFRRAAQVLQGRFVRAIAASQGVAVAIEVTNTGAQPIDGFAGYFRLTRPPEFAGDDETILFGGSYDTNFRYTGVLGSGQTIELTTDVDTTSSAQDALSSNTAFLATNQRFYISSMNSIDERDL